VGSPVHPALKENLALAAKTVLFSLGGLLLVAALVDLVVSGPTWQGVAVLAAGALFAGLPFGFALRDALRHARRGR
jgi:hypothetical protein